MTVDFEEVRQRKLYKQSGASVALTIGLPLYWVQKPDPVDRDLITVFPDDLVFVPSDRQFFHYFSSEKSRLIVEKLLKRMELDSNWVKKRIREFNAITKNFEAIGEELLNAAKSFTPANPATKI